MTLSVKSAETVQVCDLVLNPEQYREALIGPARRDGLAHDAVEHLAAVLPLAIAQLDEVGDPYGAIALDDLYGQVVRLQPMV